MLSPHTPHSIDKQVPRAHIDQSPSADRFHERTSRSGMTAVARPLMGSILSYDIDDIQKYTCAGRMMTEGFGSWLDQPQARNREQRRRWSVHLSDLPGNGIAKCDFDACPCEHMNPQPLSIT